MRIRRSLFYDYEVSLKMSSNFELDSFKLLKDHPVQESRVGRIFRQTDLNYSSWDARTADTNKFL